jgi:hypothetical protein
MFVELGRDRAIALAKACRIKNKRFSTRHPVSVARINRNKLGAEGDARFIHARRVRDLDYIADLDYHYNFAAGAIVGILQGYRRQLIYLHDHIPINLFFLRDCIHIVSRLHNINTPVFVAGRWPLHCISSGRERTWVLYLQVHWGKCFVNAHSIQNLLVQRHQIHSAHVVHACNARKIFSFCCRMASVQAMRGCAMGTIFREASGEFWDPKRHTSVDCILAPQQCLVPADKRFDAVLPEVQRGVRKHDALEGLGCFANFVAAMRAFHRFAHRVVWNFEGEHRGYGAVAIVKLVVVPVAELLWMKTVLGGYVRNSLIDTRNVARILPVVARTC